MANFPCKEEIRFYLLFPKMAVKSRHETLVFLRLWCFPHAFRMRAVCGGVDPPTLSVPTEPSALIGQSHTGRMTSVDPRSPGFQNEWASQCMLAIELNGNVKLTTDAFCLSVEGPSHWGAQTE